MLLRREAAEERDEHIDMTPMVDVVFQLMTFMLFSVQMTGGEKVDVPPARHGVGIPESTATFLTLLKPRPPARSHGSFWATAKEPGSPWTRPARPWPTGSCAGRNKVILQADGDVPTAKLSRSRRP